MFVKKWVILLAIGISLALASTVEARSFRSCSYASYNYHVPVIIKEVVAPIAIPLVVPATVFQYLPALQPVTPVIPIQGAVYTSPTPGTGSAPLNQADINRLIDQRVNETLRNIFRNGPEGPPAIPDEGQPVVNQTQLSAQVLAILKNNCASCHGNGKTSGNIRLFDVNGAWAPNVSNDDILDAIRTARMPKQAKGDSKSPAAIKGRDLAVLLTELGGR